MVVWPTTIPVAHFHGACAGSPENVLDDFIPKGETRTQTIKGIATLSLHDEVVGWIYRTATDRYFVQAKRSMPSWDQKAAGIRGINEESLQEGISGLVEIRSFPWRDLKMSACSISHS